MIDRVARLLLQSDVLKGSATALAIRFVAAVIGFAMFAVAARSMDAAAFGTLALIFNSMSFLSILALCGQETLIVRSWVEYCGSGRPALAGGALKFGALVTTGAAATLAVSVALLWYLWWKSASLPLVLTACAFLFSHALLQFSGQLTRIAVGLAAAEGPREVLWRLIVALVIGALHAMNVVLEPTWFFLTAAVALTLSIAIQVMLLAPVVGQTVGRVKPQFDIGAWVPRSFKMWLSASMDTVSQYLEVVAVGFVLGPKAAGFYFAATRITSVFAMIAGSLSTYAVPQISGLFHSNAIHELQRVLRLLAVIGGVLIGSTFLLIAGGGRLLLLIFGDAYVPVYPMLVVLALGASIAALVGPAAQVLLLTGHEGAYPRIMASGLVVRFFLIAVLGHLFGLMGAAVATTISLTFTALSLMLACRRLVGLDPSLSCVFARARRQAAKR